MAFIYDINRNFQPGTEPAVNTRGAYNFQPAEGSSNILNGGITPGPVAGKYGGTLEEIIGPGIAWSLSPEGQAEQRKAALDFYKQQGDQQMKYRLTNDIIANLGAGARAAFAGYTDPGEIARMTAGIGDAYARGAAATQGLTSLGAGVPVTRYYNV
jgi:hypothetical protein